MTLKDTIIADLSVIAADMGDQVFTWNGEDYICIPSSTSKGLNLEMGGFGGEATLVLNVRKELFTDAVYPQSQQTLTFNSATYRIESQRQDATGAFLRLQCTDNNRGV